MRSMITRRACVLGLLPAGWAISGAALAATAPDPLQPVPATRSPIAEQAAILGAAWAGRRAVAVGDHGIVLLSDDAGATFRQARAVPLSSTLTSVSFADPMRGWAVGHWGAILATTDGGETWQVQRMAPEEDRPLFAVHFFDASHGVAVGLWSLVLTTQDGGKTWVQQPVTPMAGARKADLNMLDLFADARGTVYATAERGQLLRSVDRGHSWEYLDTGYKGSLWAGAALADGTLLVGGQRGTLMRSEDAGLHWSRVPLDSRSSVTTVAQAGANVLVGGLDGLHALSQDRGAHFSMTARTGGESLTTALPAADGRWIVFSRHGLLRDIR